VLGFRGRPGGRSAQAEGGRGRVTQPDASIQIDSKSYPVFNISEAGLVISPYEGDLVPKQRVYFDLVVRLGEQERSFRIEGTVAQVKDQSLACRFNDLRRDALHAVQQLIISRSPRAVPVPPRQLGSTP
jgi:hypothetical protein